MLNPTCTIIQKDLPMRPVALKSFLEDNYQTFHRPEYLRLDPLVCLQGISSPRDLEIAALMAAMLAYGRVETIIGNVNDLFRRTGTALVDFAVTVPLREKFKILSGFKHRFNDGTDVAAVLHAAGRAISDHGSLEALFIQGMEDDDPTIKPGLDHFTRTLKNRAGPLVPGHSPQIDFLLSSPSCGSACKRMNMFLRWMIRPRDGIDFGIWQQVSPSKLVMPLDTHVATIARELKLTSRRTVDWVMAMEITAQLRQVHPFDPVRYDFSLCRTGMVAHRRRAA
jgi:uncharacterized protein (TIGR02757 family)